jgi:tetratricopeptide (TPR) repeat protein
MDAASDVESPAATAVPRYSAFISYNYKDRRAAAWLHRALETYRIPRRMQGRPSGLGPLQARLPPVFRDREELAASSDLAASVQRALEQSHALIVICSPNGARSRWVNEEIRVFTALGRRDQIRCLIIAGEPHAGALAGGEAALECLPPALFEDGAPEPLAADIRPGQDRRPDAILKLLAGIMGVSYDELRQREQARRVRRLSLLASGLGLGLVVMSTLAFLAVAERNEALRQRDIAEHKTMTAERTVEFVKSLFEVADPSEARGETITAREILDQGALQISQGLADEPSVKAELSTTLGEVYGGLGLYHKGETLVRQGLALRNVDMATRAREYLALGEAQSRQGDYDGATKSFRTAMKLAVDPRWPRPELRSRILAGLGEAQSESGDSAAADRNIRAAIDLDVHAYGAGSWQVARDLETLGPDEAATGRMEAARRDLEQALAIRLKVNGPNHPRTAEDLNSLGAIAYFQHDSRAAEDFTRRALGAYQKILGMNHPEVATTMNNLARIELERRQYAEAKPLLEHAIAVIVTQRNGSFDDLALEYDNLGLVLRGTGDPMGAEKMFQKALAVAKLRKHRNLAPIMVDLADLECSRGDDKKALGQLAAARPIMAAAYPKDPWRTAWADLITAGCLAHTGNSADAKPLVERAEPILRARWAPTTLYGDRTAQIAAMVNGH